MYELIQNAANAIPFVLVDTSGVEVTGLGGTFTVTVSKNGAGFGASAGTKAELANGWYLYTATADECNTLGPLALKITGAGVAQQNLVYAVGNTAASLAAILADTNELQMDWVQGGRLDLLVDAIKAKTDLLTSATATPVVTPVVGSKHTLTIGATFATTVTGLTIAAGWTKVLYTLKNEIGEDDAEAILQVAVSNPAAALTDGTLYVERKTATAAQRALASLTVNQAAGTVAIALGATLLADLAQHGDVNWDIKEIATTGQNIRGTGTADVTWAVTHTTS